MNIQQPTLKTETADILLAAYLRYKDVPLRNLSVVGGKATFVFDRVDPAVLEAFYFGQLLVEPRRFNGLIKDLKRVIASKA